MNKAIKSHVLVVGMGMSGLMAAYTAAKEGKEVTLLANGLGALSIASGCIDVLGYKIDSDKNTMQAISNPFEAINSLAPRHPYAIVGRESVEKSLALVHDLFQNQGVDFSHKKYQNTLVPTMIGTLKPTYIYPSASDSAPLFAAKKVTVVTVDAIRDCHPHLIAEQLQKYPNLKDVTFETATIKSHFGTAHRAVSPLDVARYVDSPAGYSWLSKALRPFVKQSDAILLPPILGTSCAKEDLSPWKKLQKSLDCSLVEMLSLPPGVGGGRLYGVFMRALQDLGIRIIENANIINADIHNGNCKALIAQGEGKQIQYKADNFIIASGGILGGGICTKPGKAYESIFNIELETPEQQEHWANADAFGSHAFLQMGVSVNEKLQVFNNNGQLLADNVYYVGRTLGAYDYAAEKSGNGVAIATAWYAVQNI